MLLMHWDCHAHWAAQGSGVKEGFHLFYLSPLFRLHRAHPFSPSFLCFSEAQILIVPTVIYQSGTLFFNRQKKGWGEEGLMCVLFLHRSDSRRQTGSGGEERRKNNLTRFAAPSHSHCPLYCACLQICFCTPLASFHQSSEMHSGFLSMPLTTEIQGDASDDISSSLVDRCQCWNVHQSVCP